MASRSNDGDLTFKQAIENLEKVKNIPREIILENIEKTLLVACKNAFRRVDNIKVSIDKDTLEYKIIAEKKVVEHPSDLETEISLSDARKVNANIKEGDTFFEEIRSLNFGRIATASARNTFIDDLKKAKNNRIYEEYLGKEHTVVTGVIERELKKSFIVNLGGVDAILTEKEQVKRENYKRNDRLKFFITDVKKTKGEPKIYVSRTHPDLVKGLFIQEVTEINDGIVDIISVAREAGNRTKIAVKSNDPDVDPVGSCVGINGSRVNYVVEELHNEKIDIVNWDESPAKFIENALSPAKVTFVIADADERTAKVVVPDYQLSLAIGKEGQNARLAARLTNFKIDIKSETQARESGEFPEFEDYYGDESSDYDYDEDGNNEEHYDENNNDYYDESEKNQDDIQD